MLQPRTKPVEKQHRSSYPVLLKITRELYTLGFRPKQRGIGDVEGGFLFLFRGDVCMAQDLENSLRLYRELQSVNFGGWGWG